MREQFEHTDNSFDLQPLIFPNALDTISRRTTGSARYESICFEVLRHLFPQDFILGPHVIDEIFGGDGRFSNLIRPDAFVFTTNEDTPVLSHIIEMKSGTCLDLTRKVFGFSVLLQKLRNRPFFLSNKIQEYVGENLAVPTLFSIPHDKNITVVFMSQLNCVQQKKQTEFPFRTINFLKIPLEQ